MGEDAPISFHADERVQQAFKWLDDGAATSEWAKRPEVDLAKLLKHGHGFAKIQGFLPNEVAEGVRLVLEGMPKKEWEQAGSGDRDDSGYADGVRHGFSILEVEPHEVLLGVARVLGKLYPDTLPNFSAARYNKSDHIAKHDDLVPECYTKSEVQRTLRVYGRDSSQLGLQAASQAWREDSGPTAGKSSNGDDVNAQLEVAMQAGDLEAVKRLVAAGGRAAAGPADADREIPYTRQVAVAYYLTRDWKAQYGGEFVDLADGTHHLPEFNTLVAFEVPRMHEVTAVCAADGFSRHSIFGWWLEKDKKPPRGRAATKKRPAAAPAMSSAKRSATGRGKKA